MSATEVFDEENRRLRAQVAFLLRRVCRTPPSACSHLLWIQSSYGYEVCNDCGNTRHVWKSR